MLVRAIILLNAIPSAASPYTSHSAPAVAWCSAEYMQQRRHARCIRPAAATATKVYNVYYIYIYIACTQYYIADDYDDHTMAVCAGAVWWVPRGKGETSRLRRNNEK